MAPAHAAGVCLHSGSLEVRVRGSPAESLHVSSVFLARSSGCQNLCHWEPGSSEPDLVRGEVMCLHPYLLNYNWPPMAQPLLLLLAVL